MTNKNEIMKRRPTCEAGICCKCGKESTTVRVECKDGRLCITCFVGVAEKVEK